MRIVNGKSFIDIRADEVSNVEILIKNVEKSEDSDERITTYALMFKTLKLDYVCEYVTNAFFYEETQDEFMSLLNQKVSSMINTFKNESKYIDPKSQVIDVASLFETYIQASFYVQLEMVSEMYSESRAAGIKVVECDTYDEDDEEDEYYDYFTGDAQENIMFERFYERMIPRIKELIKQMKINGEI